MNAHADAHSTHRALNHASQERVALVAGVPSARNESSRNEISYSLSAVFVCEGHSPAPAKRQRLVLISQEAQVFGGLLLLGVEVEGAVAGVALCVGGGARRASAGQTERYSGRAQNSPCTKMIVLRWTIAWRISYWPAVNISESNEQPSKPRGRLTERSRENSLAEKDQKGPTVNDALPLQKQNGVDTRTAAQSDKRARELTMPSFVRSSARLSYYANSITGNSSAHGWFPIDSFGLLLTQHLNPSLSWWRIMLI